MTRPFLVLQLQLRKIKNHLELSLDWDFGVHNLVSYLFSRAAEMRAGFPPHLASNYETLKEIRW